LKVKPELYATHKDSQRLYFPQWDDAGEILASKHLTAALSITQDGITFPEGSIWTRSDSNWQLAGTR
jgi:hypothetical protein